MENENKEQKEVQEKKAKAIQEKKEKGTSIPSAKKRIIQSEKRNLINRSFKSKVKSAISSFKESLQDDNPEPCKEKLDLIYSLMDKGFKKKIIKQNKASRIKGKLSLLLNKKVAKKEASSN